MAHTPGPWIANHRPNCDGRLDVEAAGFAVALVCQRASSPDNHEREANARLIAGAPDLLAGLKQLEAAVIAEGVAAELSEDEQLTAVRAVFRAIDVARGAIAKAEGRPTPKPTMQHESAMPCGCDRGANWRCSDFPNCAAGKAATA